MTRGMVNLSKLDIRDGVIYYRIRQQDGVTFVPMTVADTPSMRAFVAWVQIHD
jgi:hypothetical protein